LNNRFSPEVRVRRLICTIVALFFTPFFICGCDSRKTRSETEFTELTKLKATEAQRPPRALREREISFWYNLGVAAATPYHTSFTDFYRILPFTGFFIRLSLQLRAARVRKLYFFFTFPLPIFVLHVIARLHPGHLPGEG